MKISVRIALIIILLGITTYLGASINNKLNKKAEIARRIEQIPSFSLPDLEGKRISAKELSGKKSILIYYSINCEFCEAEAVQIKNNTARLKDYNIVMISKNSKTEIEKFRKDYGLDKSNVQFLLDDQENFMKTFGIFGEPSILLYDEDGGLIERINGSIHMNKILEKLKK